MYDSIRGNNMTGCELPEQKFCCAELMSFSDPDVLIEKGYDGAWEICGVSGTPIKFCPFCGAELK